MPIQSYKKTRPAISTQILPVETSIHQLIRRFQEVREQSILLCQPLTPEDCALQSMPDASPLRWHLAHTTWFFETFLLKECEAEYIPFDSQYEYLFNSYYNSVGKQFPRHQRGLLSRPGLETIFEYRECVDQAVEDLLLKQEEVPASLRNIIEIGLQHEQQHQELMLTDLKHLFSLNPLFPVYQSCDHSTQNAEVSGLDWVPGVEGVNKIGHVGAGFGFDNEYPRHEVLTQAYEIASRLVTNGEFLKFVEAGNYQHPEHWLSIGWNEVQTQQWKAPLYWTKQDNEWWQFTLSGLQPLNLDEPVSHISYFEADAFARWADVRLPTEMEWELAAPEEITGNFVESRQYHPRLSGAMRKNEQRLPSQMFGDLWEWTSSPYIAYPGYRAAAGAIGEYNGKFMCNQFVLRGGSCATPQSHVRATYRNFFNPAARWQFTGIRLAR